MISIQKGNIESVQYSNIVFLSIYYYTFWIATIKLRNQKHWGHLFTREHTITDRQSGSYIPFTKEHNSMDRQSGLYIQKIVQRLNDSYWLDSEKKIDSQV